MRPQLLLPAAVCAAFALSPLAASAHPSFLQRAANVGAPYRAVVRIPHGCDGSATVKVRVIIPEGVFGVKPKPMPGWTISTVRGAYARSYSYHGHTLAEGVKEIVWSGQLADTFFDEFVFAGFLADTLPAGRELYFPTYQECEKGELRWTQVPRPGQDAHALETPAPGVMLLAAQKTGAHGQTHAHMHAHKGAQKAGSLTIEAPWARATPAGAKVGGGYLKITNTGSAPDRLVGGSFAIAKSVQVHQMSMVGGVMKMRQLADGLEIAPGQTVELKPGGYHLMLMGLRGPLKAGQTVKGRLTFAKAGDVDVELKVAPISAKSSGHMHHHH